MMSTKGKHGAESTGDAASSSGLETKKWRRPQPPRSRFIVIVDRLVPRVFDRVLIVASVLALATVAHASGADGIPSFGPFGIALLTLALVPVIALCGIRRRPKNELRTWIATIATTCALACALLIPFDTIRLHCNFAWYRSEREAFVESVTRNARDASQSNDDELAIEVRCDRALSESRNAEVKRIGGAAFVFFTHRTFVFVRSGYLYVPPDHEPMEWWLPDPPRRLEIRRLDERWYYTFER